MGGSVIVSVRYEDGKTVTWDRWTNTMPYWFKNLRVYQKDPTLLDEYVKAGEPDPVTGGDFSPQPLAPDGYGLVVIDYQTGHILSHQDYSGFTSFSMYETRKDRFGDDEGWSAEFKALVDDGRISLEVERWTITEPRQELRDEPIKITAENFEEIMAAAYVLHRNSFDRDRDNDPWVVDPRFKIDTSPFKIIAFDHDREVSSTETLTRFHDKLIELNFALTAEDEAKWAEVIAEAKRYEEED